MGEAPPSFDRINCQKRWSLASLWTIPISLALLVPCFWLPIVTAVDLQSHLYNAWLEQQISSGSVHGLWIGHQYTNVLVDLILAGLLKNFGVSVAERVLTSLLVLVFFWGAFSFLSAVRGRAAWWLTPWIAILAYGYTFQVGLMNYYLSCGLILWVFGFVWNRRLEWKHVWCVPLLVLACLAHPIPVLWLGGLLFYGWLATRLSESKQLLLLLVCVVVIFLLRKFIMIRFVTWWQIGQLKLITGADQALVHGWNYLPVCVGLLLFSVVLLCGPENRGKALRGIIAQFYCLTALVIVLIPSSIGKSEGAPAGQIAERLSLLAGVLLLAVISRSAIKRWQLPAGLLIAAFFFISLYHDLSRSCRIEENMAKLVARLPSGQHIASFADLRFFPNSSVDRLAWSHLSARACLGHCFDYLDYEPSTGQFRIHAEAQSPVVVATHSKFAVMTSTNYVVSASDLPLYGLFRRRPETEDVILIPLKTGDRPASMACPDGSAAR